MSDRWKKILCFLLTALLVAGTIWVYIKFTSDRDKGGEESQISQTQSSN